ncbi:unnamed protein product [Toxocara canis]|uniref:F-box domain-containing protein n=1 Tax=Toxocara canis TaxID=6265 RepID=A0A183UIF7_TOXCA|nr:unnamed protein product [Toxocara canis]
MFVSKPDMGELKLLIGSVLPRTVEHLVLYDESHRLSLKAEEELKDFNLKVHFCGDYDLIVDNYWMNGRSELITQTIWKAPYQSYVVLQPTLPEWYCVISELMDTAIVKKMSSERLSTSSSGMFDLLSDDVIRRIYQHLEVKERGRLASVNRSFRRLFHTVRLLQHTVYLTNFCASYNELINALFSLPRLRVIHIQQRYCEEKTHLNVFDSDHAQSIVSTNVSSVKLQGVTVTSGAIEMLSFKYAKTVNTLCLIGSLMHTPDMYVYFNALNRFDKLVSLTIPPSLYSISTTNKTLFAGNYPSLKDLYLLRSMAVFVSRPDFDELKRFINAVLPPTLEHLVLFDETCRLELNVEDELKDRKPRIHFCDDDEIIVDSFWMNDRSELLTKSLWKSPYKPYAVLQPNVSNSNKE